MWRQSSEVEKHRDEKHWYMKEITSNLGSWKLLSGFGERSRAKS